ncbi:gamma-glutamyltransferase family protein [Falsirhodobacter sp. alg1]|uniref:gamma-glutamyltransferase family protein n=1 Tax=Falsirhodobacter sp. alg1 TaxID=1472418 RepID=UPI0007874761|nr:gamma-glutamyltransferase family protein [Falsirhodobacter sp. alg1]
MTQFTTRPELTGTFGMVTSTHWIASSVGMSMLEKGGNAFDAAVAAGFVLNVLEPHLNGPGGDMPAVIYSAESARTEVICAQGTTPAGATIKHYKSEGIDVIPGDGMLATVIPGAFDGWMLMLRDYGSMTVREVLEPAIHYARHGHPLLARVAASIAGLSGFFAEHWPTSYATWVPNGRLPQAGELFKNPVLADTWDRLAAEADAAGNRELGIEAARHAFYHGFVAEEIDTFCRETEVMDASGSCHRAVLNGADLAGWNATIEAPQTATYHDWTVAKTGPWGQGPVFLQTLKLLEGLDIAAMDPSGPDFVHSVIEAMKLSFADREAYYGDPEFAKVPMATLLSADYNSARRKLIGEKASNILNPGTISGFEAQRRATLDLIGGMAQGAVYEPTMAHLTEKRGDTVHIDVVDRWGNMVAVTPSGGWLQSSPIIPSLGFCLNSRAQMFWLTEGLPTSLEPGKRPRTTLTPSIAWHQDGTRLAFGTPGGDQQDQWQLAFFLRYAHHEANLQAAIDLPLFHSTHFPASFYPRTGKPGGMLIEARAGEATIAELRRRGHDVEVSGDWDIGRLTAARRDTSGLLRAAATPRLMQAYAVGR